MNIPFLYLQLIDEMSGLILEEWEIDKCQFHKILELSNISLQDVDFENDIDLGQDVAKKYVICWA